MTVQLTILLFLQLHADATARLDRLALGAPIPQEEAPVAQKAPVAPGALTPQQEVLELAAGPSVHKSGAISRAPLLCARSKLRTNCSHRKLST